MHARYSPTYPAPIRHPCPFTQHTAKAPQTPAPGRNKIDTSGPIDFTPCFTYNTQQKHHLDNTPKRNQMPFCPQCRAEYIPGIKQCKDCDVPLVDVLTQSGNTEQVEGLICSDCGADISLGDERCPKCGVVFSDETEEGITGPPQQSFKRRNPFIAALLSLITPGLGQVYNGQLRNGIGFYLSYLIFPYLYSLTKLQFVYTGLWALLATAVIYHLVIIFHAGWGSIRAKSFVPQSYHKLNTYIFVIIVTAGFLFLNILLLRAAMGIRVYRVPSGPMEPTLLVGDRFVVRPDYYRTQPLKRGDIVVYRPPDRPAMIKVGRVVALEGDVVGIRNKNLFINGDSCTEPYIQHRDPLEVEGTDKFNYRDNYGPFKIPFHSFFVLGDNRDISYDSRFFGIVDIKALHGKALYIYFSSEASQIGRAL